MLLFGPIVEGRLKLYLLPRRLRLQNPPDLFILGCRSRLNSIACLPEYFVCPEFEGLPSQGPDLESVGDAPRIQKSPIPVTVIHSF